MTVTIHHANSRSFTLENILKVKVSPVKGKLGLRVELQTAEGSTYCHGVLAVVIDKVN